MNNPTSERSGPDKTMRSALLDVDVNTLNGEAAEEAGNVAVIAVQRGEAPHREWLLVSYTPKDVQERVLVRVPGFAEVFLDTGPNGSLDYLAEDSARIVSLNSSTSSNATAERNGVLIGTKASFSTGIAATKKLDHRAPVAKWRLEEASANPGDVLIDSSGNQNHAITSFWGTKPFQGRIGTARQFSGGYATVIMTPALNSESFSMSAWVRPNSFPSSGRLAVMYSCLNQSLAGWVVGLSDAGRVVVSVGTGTAAPWLLSSTGLPLGEWSHIAVTLESSTRLATLYVNGQKSIQGVFSGGKLGPGYPLSIATIGKASWIDSYYLDGVLDEVAIFDVTLDSAEIEAEYQGNGSELPSTAPRTPSAQWKFDEAGGGAGELLIDSSGNSNHATASTWGTSPATGQFAGGRRFSGGYGVVALNSALQAPSFSMGSWVLAKAFPTSGRLATLYSTFSPDATGWVVGLDDRGRVILSIGTGTGAPWLVSSAQLTIGEWRRIDVTFDHATRKARIYIDGLLDTTGSFLNPTVNATTNPTIGRASWIDSYYFDGVLDELAIYQVALTESELAHFSVQPEPQPESPVSQLIVRDAEEFRSVIANGVEPGTLVRVAPGDYIGPFPTRTLENMLRGTSEHPIVISALDPAARPVIHWRSSWLGPLEFVEFRQLDFTGRINIDGDPSPSGRRNYGVSFRDVRWSLCGWGGQSECLKATKGEAMTIEFVTFFAVQAYKAGLNRLSAHDRARMSPYTLSKVDSAIAEGKDLGRATDMPIDFVAVNNSVIRSVLMETSGTHASIQIKGGSSGNVVENNMLSGWAVPHFRMVSRNINLAGGTCDLCFRQEGFRQFEAYDTIVRGNRIECGDACGALATQVGTRWINNTHWMVAGQGNCVSPSTEPASRWAMRLTNEASADHVDEVRPSHDAAFERNVWVYKKCASSAEFVNRGKLCADGVDVNVPGQDCVAFRTINWKDNVVYELDWAARIPLEVNPWDANLRVRHCHATVTQVAQNWDSPDSAGLGDISGQCVGRQGENGLDPLLIDPGLPSMRISEPFYESLGIGANALFPWGTASTPGAR